MDAEQLRIELSGQLDSALSMRMLIRGRRRVLFSAFRDYLPTMPVAELEKIAQRIPDARESPKKKKR